MKITINSPLDMHIHLRQGDMLKVVAPLSAESFAGGVVMPNLVPPVDTPEKIEAYLSEINKCKKDKNFTPYMTLFFKNYSREILTSVKDKIIGIKLYPAGITTNSEGGVKTIEESYPTFQLMQELGIPLLVHGESNGFVMDREREFISIYELLAKNFPALKIVMEHITTKSAVDFLNKYDNVFATVTLHHLYITLDDLAGGMLNPHLFCKPIAKRPEDREALLNAALNAHPKLMFGSDSAPHPVHKKEATGCAAGIFTAPIALPLLAELFEKHDKLDNLQAFVSDNAKNIYAINPPEKKVKLEKKDFIIPIRYGEVVPFKTGETVSWSITDISLQPVTY